MLNRSKGIPFSDRPNALSVAESYNEHLPLPTTTQMSGTKPRAVLSTTMRMDKYAYRYMYERMMERSAGGSRTPIDARCVLTVGVSGQRWTRRLMQLLICCNENTESTSLETLPSSPRFVQSPSPRSQSLTCVAVKGGCHRRRSNLR